MKVLILEDDIVSALLLEKLLGLKEIETFVAFDPDRALSAARSFRPDLLVTDFLLGHQLDGCDVLAILARELPALRAILFSGLEAPDFIERCRGLPVEKVIVKPLDVDELFAAIDKCMPAGRTKIDQTCQ